MGFREVNAIKKDQESVAPKHLKADGSKPKHYRPESPWPKILKAVISVELVSVILSCCFIYSIWYRGVAVDIFSHASSAALVNASGSTYEHATDMVQTYREGIAEEMYEYVWTTEDIEYRTGADASYKSAGTLKKDKLVRRTGITRSGWSRVALEDGEYFIPKDKLSTYTPEGLPIASGVKGEYQKYALSLLPDFGWEDSELAPLIYLWNRESGWNPLSHNKRSGAHGIPQALPGSKMASEGSDYYTNPEPQIRWGLKYIARRYGSPSSAWAHFQSRGWY